jgi:hypothetical protein
MGSVVVSLEMRFIAAPPHLRGDQSYVSQLLTIRSQINLVLLLCLGSQGSTEHFCNFEKNPTFVSDFFNIFIIKTNSKSKYL